MLTNNLFDPPRRRDVRDLNIVPIIDMLVTIIFFLLLSTSFFQFNKLTVPPSKTSVISSPERPPPLQTKMLLFKDAASGDVKLTMFWNGAKPGSLNQKIAVKDDNPEFQKTLGLKAKDFATRYKAMYAEEKTLQVGLSPDLTVSSLIVMMDSVREALPDIVLLSYKDTQAHGSNFSDEETQ